MQGPHKAKGFATKEAYRFSTTIGTMAIGWQGEKIIATHLPEPDDKSLLDALRLRMKDPFLQWSPAAPAMILRFISLIEKHLAGEPQRFPLDLLDIESQSPFFRKVYTCAHGIPPGTCRTYGDIAREAGSPKAMRAVGQAMAKNPFPLVIPCHRVVGNNRALVGFSAHGGLDTKTKLLALESYAGRPLH